MKATRFVLREHARIRRCIALLEVEDAPGLLADVVERVLSFLAIEEDLFYPAIARLCEPDLARFRDDVARVEAALLGVLGASDQEQRRRRIASLLRAHVALAQNDLGVAPLAERVLGDARLEELGAKMVRSFEGAVRNDEDEDADDGGGAATLH
jgi:hypothetical protein